MLDSICKDLLTYRNIAETELQDFVKSIENS